MRAITKNRKSIQKKVGGGDSNKKVKKEESSFFRPRLDQSDKTKTSHTKYMKSDTKQTTKNMNIERYG